MANKWFETVAVAQRRAKKHLPKSVYGALIAGAEAGVTVRDNVGAFSELGFAPHDVLGLAADPCPYRIDLIEHRLRLVLGHGNASRNAAILA